VIPTSCRRTALLQKDLRKTIIFVSHDLDEALRLGNRIAILEGGRIVQCGAAEDILLRPANDYVAEFVKHMNPLNVLRGGALMTRPQAETADGEVHLDASGAFAFSSTRGQADGLHARRARGRYGRRTASRAVAARGRRFRTSSSRPSISRCARRSNCAARRAIRFVLVRSARPHGGLCGDDEILSRAAAAARAAAG